VFVTRHAILALLADDNVHCVVCGSYDRWYFPPVYPTLFLDMIAEVLLVLAGHSSSLFEGTNLSPSLAPLVHPGERECLESLARMASRYRKIKSSCTSLARVRSRYICAFASTLDRILKDEYEHLVVETEAKVLLRDANLVASGSFVPLSSIRATFSIWDAPLTALESLIEHIETKGDWQPGPLIDLLLERANTGVHQVSALISRLSAAVQRVWRAQISAFVVHGSLSVSDPLANPDYVLVDGAMPSCVSPLTRDSIVYVGRAIGTVKAAKWQKQPPRALATEHTALIENVLPEDQHSFNRVIAQIRTNVSEWLWLNVLTEYDVEDAVNTLYVYLTLYIPFHAPPSF
jgi:gamma-tubulin complex component 4